MHFSSTWGRAGTRPSQLQRDDPIAYGHREAFTPPPPLCRRYINVLFTLNPLPREVSFFLEVAQHSETLAGGSMRVSRYKKILAPAHPPTKQSPPRIVPRPHIARRPTTMIKDGSHPE